MTKRATTTVPSRKPKWWTWSVIALTMIAGAILATILLWPENEVAAPVLGELTWSHMTDAPAHLLAITATPDGFLAAAAASAGGVEFWTTSDGETWQLASDQTTFEADEVVWRLSGGPSGFLAWALRVAEGESDPATVWTSSDGLNWNRSNLTVGPEDTGTTYLQHWSEVTETVSGPNGFVALGMSALGLDIDAILADFAPEASTAHYTVEEGPSSVEISTEDGTELELTYTELGITPEQRQQVRAAQPSHHLWWSGDGITWAPIDIAGIQTRIEATEGSLEDGIRIENLVGTEAGFYLFASPRLGFLSGDGSTWVPFEMQGLPEELGFRVAAIDDGLVLFGSEETHGYFSGGLGGEQSIWTSFDGRNWTRGNLDVPVDLDQDLEFEVEGVAGGRLGILAQGATMQRIERIQSVELIKDGYVLTMGMDSWTLSDEATGDFIAETGRGIEIGDSPTGAGTFPIVDSATGEELLVVTQDDIEAAEQAAIETVDTGQPESETEPTNLLGFTSDGTTWATGEVAELFGDDAAIFGLAVGQDRAVVLILNDLDGLAAYVYGEGDLPAIEVWIGEPGE